MTDYPLQQFFKLGELTQAGSDVAVAAKPEALAALAEWAGVSKVTRWDAAVRLKRLSTNRFSYEADLVADVVQACVVTLDPVKTHLKRHIARELHFAPNMPEEVEVGELTLSAGDDEVPETIASLHYDLAGPLLEEFLLAIDPYPRKRGAAFTPPPSGETPPENPFAVLKALKDRE